ncbi:unnamed protein product [Rangifer tarandus platyrhynchus]|uniref:Uncharacterized protein n=1 Tax=Rangifer tarandus platyrhynchus TaxID=3082113 RepID=A0AC60A1V2_RANTA
MAAGRDPAPLSSAQSSWRLLRFRLLGARDLLYCRVSQPWFDWHFGAGYFFVAGAPAWVQDFCGRRGRGRETAALTGCAAHTHQLTRPVGAKQRLDPPLVHCLEPAFSIFTSGA